MMEIKVNGEKRSVSPGLTVRDLLLSLELNPDIIIVEKNREILRKDDFAAVTLAAGDHLELIRYMGGG